MAHREGASRGAGASEGSGSTVSAHAYWSDRAEAEEDLERERSGPFEYPKRRAIGTCIREDHQRRPPVSGRRLWASLQRERRERGADVVVWVEETHGGRTDAEHGSLEEPPPNSKTDRSGNAPTTRGGRLK